MPVDSDTRVAPSNATAPLAVILVGTSAGIPAGIFFIPLGIMAVKFDGGHTACHSFELAAECAAAS